MRKCKAVLLILEWQYPCEYHAPHEGLAHCNSDAGAMWTGDDDEPPELMPKRYKQREERKNVSM